MEVAVNVYTVPTDRPDSDGTFEWSSTTLVADENPCSSAPIEHLRCAAGTFVKRNSPWSFDTSILGSSAPQRSG